MAALREYITIDDVTNKTFMRFPEATRQHFVDEANLECEDLAIRRGVDPTDIADETHFKLKKYLVNYTLSLLAEDNIGFNSKDGTFQGEDIYESLFKRSQFLLQDLKPQIVESVLTGVEQTPDNRAVFSQRIVRA
jgi:hypothetical protein